MTQRLTRICRSVGADFRIAASIGCALASACAFGQQALASDPPTMRKSNPKSTTVGLDGAASVSPASEVVAPKNYWFPLIEILSLNIVINRANNLFGSSTDYQVTVPSIKRNLRGPWVTDNDPFDVNQFLHPYQGALYYGFARSSGYDFWASMGYTFAGSLMWETLGEQTPPARNDVVASGIAGSFLGEPLFRMAHLVLEKGNMSRTWRELAATAIHPSVGFNRFLLGEGSGRFVSGDPAYYARLQLGLSGVAQRESGTSRREKRGAVLADFSMEYGLPGKTGYSYRRPFDYFSFQVIGSSANIVDNLLTRGLLVGTDYRYGDNYRGIWGLYGSYAYLAPQVFRVSSTALSIGTTGQYWLSDENAFQGTAMAGIGYAGAGTLGGTSERDYHYGLAPQLVVAGRWIYGDRASLDVTAHEYYVSRAGGDRAGHDNIVRADASLTWRVKNEHGVAIKYLYNRRDASYPDLGRRTQTNATIGLYYVFLGKDRLGAIDWRQH